MRDIRFRAWDKNLKVMLEKYAFQGINGELHPALYKDHCPNLILMQYTGLLDKNGKEIYEGDIVKFLYSQPVKGITFYEVYWREEVAGFEFLEFCDKDTKESWMPSWDHCAACGDVVGNVYETPELLKQDGEK